MKPTAFAHFERTLGDEHRARTERDIEAGVVEAPKARKPGTGRPRKSFMPPDEPKPKLDANGKVEMRLPVSPKFTAAAALTAAKRGITTQAVIEEWMTTIAWADEPQNPAPREAMFSLNLAVGPDAFPPDVFHDLCKFADTLGVSPERLATGIVKQRLAEERAKAAEGAAAA